MRALDRKLVRDLRRIWAQSLAIALVLACGIMVLVLSQGAQRSLAETRDAYYDRHRFADVFASLTRAPEVQAIIQTELERVNKKFARVEQIKKFFLLDTQLSAEDEELTPTMKLKRKLVEKKYAAQIDAMYR